MAAKEAKALLAKTDAAFLSDLQEAFGTRLGLLQTVSARTTYPLGLHWMPQPIGPSTVYLGNAAQTLHPVMGQGFNLVLRDIITLVDLWQQHPEQSMFAAHQLLAYARARDADRKRVMQFSDLTVHSFCKQWLPLRVGRQAFLQLADLSTTIKQNIAHLSMGQHTQLPDLACEEILQ